MSEGINFADRSAHGCLEVGAKAKRFTAQDDDDERCLRDTGRRALLVREKRRVLAFCEPGRLGDWMK